MLSLRRCHSQAPTIPAARPACQPLPEGHGARLPARAPGTSLGGWTLVHFTVCPPSPPRRCWLGSKVVERLPIPGWQPARARPLVPSSSLGGPSFSHTDSRDGLARPHTRTLPHTRTHSHSHAHTHLSRPARPIAPAPVLHRRSLTSPPATSPAAASSRPPRRDPPRLSSPLQPPDEFVGFTRSVATRGMLSALVNSLSAADGSRHRLTRGPAMS